MSTPIPGNDAELTAWEVAAATGGDVVRLSSGRRSAKGLVTDSRAVGPGTGFFALAGASFDGHAFLDDAMAKGASLLVVRRGSSPPGPGDVDVVEVADTTVAWGLAARAHLRRWRRGSPAGRTVAITGSSGKTTTKELTLSLLRRAGACHATSGNLNNRVGVPAVAWGVTAETRFAIFEVGMSEPGEIAALAAITEPDVGVLVNVGVAHAGGVGGTRAAVAREKGALLEALPRLGTAVVNLDDEAAAAQAMRCTSAVVTFGRAAGADYRLLAREPLGTDGSRLRADRRGEVFEATLPLLGEGAAIDALAALAAADAAYGAPLAVATVQAALLGHRPLGGRALLTRLLDDILAIDDTYNANPASVRQAIETLGEVAGGARRRVAVLGEMRELGALAEREHEALGDLLAHARVDLVIGCGGLIDRTLARAAGLGVAVLSAASSADAAVLACREVRPGDAVLLKGSRSAAVEVVLGALTLQHGVAGP